MLDIFCKSNLFPVSQSCFILLGYALKNGSSHFLNMKQLLTSSLNNKILYCHFTKCFVVLPVRNNASQFIFIVLGTVNFFFNLFCSLCCFSVQFNKKKKKVGCSPPLRKGQGGGMATLAEAPSSQGLCLVVSSTSLMPLAFSYVTLALKNTG